MNRMLCRSLLPSSLVAFVLIVVMVGVASGQTCTYCSYNFGEHRFSGATCDAEESGCWGCEDTPSGHIGCHAFDYEGECSNGHNLCAPELAATEMHVLDALRQGDMEALYTHFQNSDRIAFNVKRRAIQLRGCNDGIAIHIPITSRQVADLLATRANVAMIVSGVRAKSRS